MSVTADVLSVLAAWRALGDMPPGLGCRWCHDEPPASHGICQSCWMRRLVGWTWAFIEGWVNRQDVIYARNEERRIALKMWRHPAPFTDPDPSGIIAYAERYGVWLVSEAAIAWRLAL